jgi:hypothetical protein
MNPSPDLPFDLDEVIDALRAGGTLTNGGSRCHSSIGHGAQGWYRSDFDEGAEQTQAIDEAQARALAAAWPQACIALLRQRRWWAVRAAHAAGDVAATLRALESWQAWGDAFDNALILRAWLTQPPERWDAPVRDAIARRFRDGTLYHLYMELHGWPRKPGTAAGCLAWVDALLRGLPEAPADLTNLRARLAQDAAREGAAG